LGHSVWHNGLRWYTDGVSASVGSFYESAKLQQWCE